MDTVKPLWYDDYTKCPMHAFIDCLVDENYKALLIEGDADDYILHDAYFRIKEQYVQALGDYNQAMLLKLIREINYDTADLNIARTILDIASTAWIDRYGKRLNKILKVDYRWDATNRVEFTVTLKRWESRLPGMEMRIDLKRSNAAVLEQRIAKNARGGKPTREDFSTIFNMMEEYYQVPVSETITVARYCDRFRRMSRSRPKPNYNGRRTR